MHGGRQAGALEAARNNAANFCDAGFQQQAADWSPADTVSKRSTAVRRPADSACKQVLALLSGNDIFVTILVRNSKFTREQSTKAMCDGARVDPHFWPPALVPNSKNRKFHSCRAPPRLRRTSITPLYLNPRDANNLYDAIIAGVLAAKGTKQSLVLTLDEKGPLGFYGWGDYVDVRAATHDPKTQAKCTTVLYRGEMGMLERLREGLPGFRELERMALGARPEKKIAFVHVLQQRSAQACFGWHTDTATEGYEEVVDTLVVLLSTTRSSMEVKGEDAFFYEGVGAAALFPSAAVHRSGAASPGTCKIVLMLKHASPSAPP